MKPHATKTPEAGTIAMHPASSQEREHRKRRMRRAVAVCLTAVTGLLFAAACTRAVDWVIGVTASMTAAMALAQFRLISRFFR
jgi:hypothetical protein